MLRPMAYTGGSPHNTLNFTRVEHLYKRITVYLRPAYKLSFTQQIYLLSSFLLLFTFFFICLRFFFHICPQYHPKRLCSKHKESKESLEKLAYLVYCGLFSRRHAFPYLIVSILALDVYLLYSPTIESAYKVYIGEIAFSIPLYLVCLLVSFSFYVRFVKLKS